MPPGQLRNKLLRNVFVRPFSGQRLHVDQVSRRHASHVREGRAQVSCQLFVDLRSPSGNSFPRQNFLPDPPVEQDEFAIHSEARLETGETNLFFKGLEPSGVVSGSEMRHGGGGYGA